MLNKNFEKYGFFVVFLGMYTLLDSFNLSYKQMNQQYGWYLPVINIGLNIFMAYMSGLMLSSSSSQFKELKGSNMSFVSIVFGIFTYGCTTCVITFLASLGITFSVAVLPFAGLPYKLISAVLIVIGYLWTQKEIRNTVCKI